MRIFLVLVFMFWAGQAWAVCTNPDGVKGEFIYNEKYGIPQYCDGEKWWGMGWKDGGGGDFTPAGAVMAFDLADCPVGWSAYVPAQGRVVRGIDPSGTVDVDGVRVAGDVQADAFQGHHHKVRVGAQSVDGDGLAGSEYLGTNSTRIMGSNAPGSYGTQFRVTGPSDDGVHNAPRIASETRMKNVALLYCRKD